MKEKGPMERELETWEPKDSVAHDAWKAMLHYARLYDARLSSLSQGDGPQGLKDLMSF